MSRAFVKEDDAGGGIEPLPDRPVSPHPNIVTPHGLADIDAHLAELQHRHAAAIKAEDRAALAAIARDLRYWSARRASAQVVKAPDAPSEVAFGTTVTIERDDGRRQTWRHRRRGRSRARRGHAVLRVAGGAAALHGQARRRRGAGRAEQSVAMREIRIAIQTR